MGSNVPIEMPEGSKWGSWEVLGPSHAHPKTGNRYYNCVCSCGNRQKVEGSRLRKGKSTQCKRCAGKKNGRKGLYTKSKNCSRFYAMRCGPYVKFGVSNNPQRRLKDLLTHNPYTTELIWEEENDEGLEEFYHTLYKDKHHRGEWFLFG